MTIASGSIRSVQLISCVWLLWPHGLQEARPPCPSPTPRVYPNLCLLSWWCNPTISSSVIHVSCHLQSFPASGSFQMRQFFTSGGQSIGVSASASVLPMNIQDWFPLGWTSWISLLSKGLSRVFSNTIVQKHQFFGAQICSSWQLNHNIKWNKNSRRKYSAVQSLLKKYDFIGYCYIIENRRGWEKKKHANFVTDFQRKLRKYKTKNLYKYNQYNKNGYSLTYWSDTYANRKNQTF